MIKVIIIDITNKFGVTVNNIIEMSHTLKNSM